MGASTGINVSGSSPPQPPCVVCACACAYYMQHAVSYSMLHVVHKHTHHTHTPPPPPTHTLLLTMHGATGGCKTGCILLPPIPPYAVKYLKFLRLRCNVKPSRGPFHYRAPSRILWRTVRGMIPHKTKRGMEALNRLKVYDGVPPPYDKVS